MNKENTIPLLSTNRSLLKMIFLGIITLGIYPIVVYSGISRDINILASRYDGRKTMHYCLMLFVFTPITGTVAAFLWSHRLCRRVGRELRRRGLPYRFGAGSFWGWNILGTLLLVGPFVFVHKLMTAMNLLCADYNARG